MAQKKLLTIAGLLATAGTAGVLGFSSVSAETSSGSSSLVEKLAQKFSLNKDEVQKVFDEVRSEKEAAHEAKVEERLAQAVKDGKLTEEQKTKILAKLKELQENKPGREELEGKTDEERRAFKEQMHTDLKQWAEENDIPEEYLQFKVIHKNSAGGSGVHIKHFEGREPSLDKEAPDES
ncbi:MAG TPA: hypothetical protein VK674_03195 [Candidatus Limnocylindria bacterium]|nr:hypothetical protein [Candidatus Limnocylindria bacterium]